MTEEPVAIQFGITLDDMRLSVAAYRVAVDIDVENCHDVFRFAVVPIEDVEISVPWDSPLSRQLKLVAEQFK